jgi:hypothetical protein
MYLAGKKRTRMNGLALGKHERMLLAKGLFRSEPLRRSALGRCFVINDKVALRDIGAFRDCPAGDGVGFNLQAPAKLSALFIVFPLKF